MATVASTKGVRTRYRNTLDKELRVAKDLLKQDVSRFELSDMLKQIQKSKCLLKTYSEKLMLQVDKLSQILDEDEADFLEKALDEDCQLNFLVEDCLIELDQFNESLCPSDVRAASQDEPSNATRLVDIQESMKDLMRTQIDQQLELLKNLDRKGKVNPNSVKLPKIELYMFYGNKLQWREFWDVFECTVHKNSNLSNVEKFSYLQTKLGGEAKRAVAGLARSNENYEIALRLLHERYGNQQEIVDLHYKALMNVHSPLNKVESLRSFIDTTEKHLRSLEVLGENVTCLCL